MLAPSSLEGIKVQLVEENKIRICLSWRSHTNRDGRSRSRRAAVFQSGVGVEVERAGPEAPIRHVAVQQGDGGALMYKDVPQ